MLIRTYFQMGKYTWKMQNERKWKCDRNVIKYSHDSNQFTARSRSTAWHNSKNTMKWNKERTNLHITLLYFTLILSFLPLWFKSYFFMLIMKCVKKFRYRKCFSFLRFVSYFWIFNLWITRYELYLNQSLPKKKINIYICEPFLFSSYFINVSRRKSFFFLSTFGSAGHWNESVFY